MRAVVLGLLALLTVVGSNPATAADYPGGRSIRLVVGFAPGGGADVAARLVARRMGEILKTSIVVENRGGAGGVLAAAVVAGSKPDGYTLLWGSSGAFSLSPAIGIALSYDPLTDFSPISRAVTLCNVLVTSTTSPYKTVGQLITAARADPGKLTYGTPGIGSAGDTSAELLLSLAGIKMTHVPFKGGSEVTTNLLVGDIDFGVVTVSTVRTLGRDRLNAIAVTSATRDPLLPDVPTFQEAGVAGYDASFWYGLLAPKNTPKAIVETLNAAVREALADPNVIKADEQLGVTAAPDDPEEFSVLIAAENRKWRDVIAKRH